MKILYIEDNPANVKLMSAIVSRMDNVVLKAVHTAELGLGLAKELNPDLILMDMSLPVMDGYDATRAIKADPDLAGILIIGLSAHAMSGDEEKALAAGCDGYLAKPLDEDLLFGNEIFQSRMRGIGVIPAQVAKEYGLSGANLRASGVDYDLRRDQELPLSYDMADFKVWTHPDGDSWARCWVRLQETREATKIVDQLIDDIPAGPVMAKVPRIIKVPEGEAYVSTENPLGEMGYYVVSKGDLGPFRVKIRSASFNNISITPWALKGVYVPDIITILGSLYFILGDIDR